MVINLNDVIAAIEDTTADQEFCCNSITGEIVLKEDAGDGDEWILLPDRNEIDDYGNMVSFIEQKTTGTAKEWLSNAIRGRGAFRMFRATLERFDLLQQWYDYSDRMHRATAIDWCEYYGLEYDTQLYDDADDDYEEEEPAEEEVIVPAAQPIPLRMVDITKDNVAAIIYMVDAFLGGNSDLEEAEEHIRQFLTEEYDVTAVSDKGRFVGYSVNKEEKMLELYVRPENRRNGIGTMLLKGIEAVYQEVTAAISPGNDVMLQFMKHNGYGTVKEVVLSKKGTQEAESCTIGSQNFKY